METTTSPTKRGARRQRITESVLAGKEHAEVARAEGVSVSPYASSCIYWYTQSTTGDFMSAVVLITGASTGFGRDGAERLARRGHKVIATMRDIAGRNRQHCDSLEALTKSEGLSLNVVDLDVTDDSSVQSAVLQGLELYGRLDAVINNWRYRSSGAKQ